MVAGCFEGGGQHERRRFYVRPATRSTMGRACNSSPRADCGRNAGRRSNRLFAGRLTTIPSTFNGTSAHACWQPCSGDVARGKGSPPGGPRSRAVRPALCGLPRRAEGDGRGIAAAYLFPKPRNFRAGRFRLVSTSNNVPIAKTCTPCCCAGCPVRRCRRGDIFRKQERDALVDEVMRLRRDGAGQYYIARSQGAG